MELTDIAEFVTDPGMLAAVFAAVACFATILTIALPAFQSDKLETRLQAVTNRREQLRRQNRAQLEQKGLKQNQGSGFMKDTVDKLDLQKLLEDPNVKDKMVQAGLRGGGPLATFYFFRFALPFAFAGAAFFYVFVLGMIQAAPQMRIAIVVFAAAAGFYAPNLYLSNLAKKRQASIMRAFPDALDMMLICVEAGMSIEMAFERVGGEIGAASTELAEELKLTNAELSYLADRREAYDNLAKRTNHPGVKAVCMALAQAERYGTPLGSSLRVMAKENRELRIAEAEKKAAALPAKLTVPMIVFFLPVLFLVILGPAYIKFTEMEQ
ncbi:type II secretion system F family protein [Ponticaulis sp.]|uniref:type II secretion system F family protein n=1 Tax=Ponticaulis sp. TaxID=2020902 RepID=UPI000B6BEA46|nr:type II secretion system F family protein [Ponticaulis sp.]MAJ09532.1 type II secretion system protein [Ponticaulis sp.]RPG18875.1 MAG: type II secretion system F family protein [Hyphomonadaceae bacterium TMED125]HBH88253.1 type II secretion system protein [Hyphomonadaceae bacterium]HBJ91584.1 type II secretion system protein [Hyphomonadaceae bacterium]|tara:strand:+ start:11187 stop:12161 length:975 start_codon:yes stop_codon:yes gene_type:complete